MTNTVTVYQGTELLDSFTTIEAALATIGNVAGDYKFELSGTFDENVHLAYCKGVNITFVKAEGATAAITGAVIVGNATNPGHKGAEYAWNGNLRFEGITFDYTKATANTNRFEIRYIGTANTLDIVDCFFNGPGMINANYNAGQPDNNKGDADGDNGGNLFGTPWAAATGGVQGKLTVTGTTFTDGNINFWRNSVDWSFTNCDFIDAPVTILGNSLGDSYDFINCDFSLTESKAGIASYLLGASNNSAGIKVVGGTMKVAEGVNAPAILSNSPNNNGSSSKAMITIDGTAVTISENSKFIVTESYAETTNQPGSDDSYYGVVVGSKLSGVAADNIAGATNVDVLLADGTVLSATGDGVTSAKLTTIYIDPSFTAASAAAEGKTLGIDAFTSLDGLKDIVAGVQTLVFAGGNATSHYTFGWGDGHDGRFYLDHSATIKTVGEGYALFGFDGEYGGAGIHIGKGTLTDPFEVVFAEDSKIKAGDLCVWGGANLTIKGALSMGVYTATPGEKMYKGVFNFTGKVTIAEGSDFDLNGAMFNNGTLIVNEDFTIQQTRGAGITVLASRSANATAEINGAVFTFNGFNAGHETDNILGISTYKKDQTGDYEGVVTLNNATLDVNNAQFWIGAKGSLTINNSTLDVEKTLVNDGTVTVSGASTVKIATVSGNGIILDSATLTADSNIGGSAVTKIYGTSTIKGTVGTVYANWAGAKVDGKYAGYTTEAVALTLDGATTGLVYVGSDTEGYAATLTVKGSSNVGGIYSRVYGTTTITGSGSSIDYINAKGSVIVDDADATIKAMVAEGGNIEITDSTVGFAIGTSNCIQLDEGTTMTVTGSDIDVQQMSIDATSALVLNNSTINVDDVYNEGDIITNNGSITISGESTVKLEKIDGSGWVYMNGATIDEETSLKGAKVRFASGTNILDGAILNNVSYFQVGQGSKFGGEAVDTNIDSAGVIVNATNGAQIGSNGSDYTGWIGSQFGAEVGTAKYTLNMTDSTGYFGYLHIYKDGFLNFTNTENVTTTFHGGTFIVNNKANFTGGQLDFIYTTVNSNATLTINGSDVLFNHTNSADRASVTVYGSLKITDSTVALGKKMDIKAGGQVTLSNTDVSIYNGASTIVNNGTFNVEQGSTITVGSFTNNGTINFTAGSTYKGGLLIDDADNTGSTYNLDNVNITVEGQSGFEAVVIDGDLYAINKNAIYVDYSWADEDGNALYGYGEEVEEDSGMYFGINAFASLEAITPALTAGPRTVYFDYAATTVAGLVITVNGQSTITNYTFDGVSYNVLNGKQREHDIKLVWNEDTNQYEFSGAFNFSSGDFSFKEIETIVKNSNTSTAVTPDAGITEKVQIGGVSGDKSYTFSLTAISDFKYTISGLEGAGRLTLTNKAGEVVATRLFGSNGTYVLSELGQGDYKATFEGYGYRNDEAEFTVQFEFDRIEVEVLNDERANATAVNFAETQEIENAIGSGDGVDWFAITGMAPAADGTLVMDFDVEGQGKGSQILVNVYKVTGGKSQTIGGFVVNDTDALGEYDLRKTFYGVSAGDTIYVQVFGYGESEYTINLAQPTSL